MNPPSPDEDDMPHPDDGPDYVEFPAGEFPPQCAR